MWNRLHWGGGGGTKRGGEESEGAGGFSYKKRLKNPLLRKPSLGAEQGRKSKKREEGEIYE